MGPDSLGGERPPPLETYRRKRDPDRTPEPFGGRPSGGRLFVVQKHAARRLHYDLRLEIDGVLKSWAVPRGPSGHVEDKRLAVLVEDHPVEYGDFEGVIPPGNYGAGAVIVWDHGWYRSANPEEPLAQLARGTLEVEIFGYKMRGRWTLARMAGGEGRDWLLLKKADGAALPPGAADLTERYPQSVLSGLTVEQMADRAGHLAAVRARVDAMGPRRGPVDARAQRFALATRAETAFADPAWLYEIKYDGVRVLAERRGDRVTLHGRGGDTTSRYPEIVRALEALAIDRFLIDGEIVTLDESGRPRFQRLQPRMGLTDSRDIALAARQRPAIGVFFDCLELEERDLRRLPLTDRKECLRMLVPALGPVRYGDHVVGEGVAFYEAACAQGLEGTVAKKARAPYPAGRTRDWIKIKCQRRQAFAIGGYTEPQGTRAHFGALHLGVYEGPPDAPRLVYVSKVGTGFDGAGLAALRDRLRPLARATPPFDEGAIPRGRGHHWVEPRLACEVRFTEWTEEGGLRQPTFIRVLEGHDPRACRRESEEPTAAEPSPIPEPAAPSGPPAAAPPAERRLQPTNLRKVLWPLEGYTKADLLDYYERIAPWMLPYLRDRPLVLTRYPDGIAGKSFYQKDAPEFTPAWVRTERIYSRDTARDIAYLVGDDVEMLRYVANSAALLIHCWASRVPSLERPDWLVLDLDPKGAPFTDVVTVALALRRILDDLDLPSYVKTSGATGLHILVPLGARYTYEQARTFARLLATLGVEATPEISTVARPIRDRGGKVYIDFGQNGYGQTIVAPFSVRPLPGAPASCPLEWREVTPRLDPTRFTMKTMVARFEKMADPLRAVLDGGVDIVAAIERLQARVAGGGVSGGDAPPASGRTRGRSRPPRA
ncbi:MAG TPA: DNA ligase D [Methylomirabilota bacterium]|nr:DNA ligase D [Methylomirabilota bacterium]